MPGSESESESDIDLDHPHGYLVDEDEEQNEPSLLEPPPSYEQSIAASSTPSSSTSSSSTSRQQQHSSRSNPFLQINSHGSRVFAHGLSSSQDGQQFSSSSSDQEIFVPSIAPRHPPSAPPLNLLASTSSNSINHRSSSSRGGGPSMRTSRTLGDLNSTTANTFNNTSTTTATYTTIPENDSTADERRSSNLRGKRPVKNRDNITNIVNDYNSNIDNDVETLTFGEQTATSPSYMHPSATSSSTSVASSQQNGGASAGQLRTARRLQHKQAHARHAASAPNFYPPQPQPHEVSAARAAAVADALQAPRVPLSQSVIPAPPPRLLQFRSREPSSVPSCPFLLCQKPIAYTKTRRERGVTVWIICGLLFLCNTYWTTQSLISYFSPPNHDRVYSQDTTDTFANSGFSAKGEARHLVKGFLGFKTHRYKDPQFKKYQRHQSALKRPTIATVGVVQDDTSALRAVLSFVLMAVMAIVRWWMCLTPLLIRPLFDTVHSCPHPHPYPFPEELEQERKEEEEEERREEEEFRRQLVRQQSLQEGLSWASWYGGDEKERLRARDEAERVAGRVGGTSTPGDDFSRDTEGHCGHDYSSNNPSTGGESQEPPVTSTPISETTVAEEDADKEKSKDKKSQKGGGRFKFWRRFRAARQQRQEQGKQVLATTVIQFKKKQLSWRARRELKKKEEKRKAIIKASQDIGRFSLLFQLGSFFLLDRWGQSTVVGPGKQQRQH